MDAVTVPAGETELPLLASRVIPKPFRHGFTTRAGGVSAATPFATLNLGMKWGDTRENVLENRRRVRRAAGGVMHVATQVHGARVVRVRAGDDPKATGAETADALCSDAVDVALAVFVADCVPILLADVRTGVFAAVHAGWRGTVAGVVPATVAALAAKFGSRPGDLRAALGPCIGRCCFEVGEEVAAAFRTALPDADAVVIERAGRRPCVDLRRAQRLMLDRAGVPADALDVGEECTMCDPAARFFSYRRDRGLTGQHLGFITRG